MDTTISIDLGQIARELNLPTHSVQRTLELLEEGNTVPFITRFRKDQTGALDEEQVREIVERAAKLKVLAERKQTILKSVEAQGRLTPELLDEIRAANSAKRLEDLYFPFKPKKQTLATVARQRGLEPLAQAILDSTTATPLEELAGPYVAEEKSLPTDNDVLQGVRHLLAEHFSESANLRDRLRKLIRQNGRLVASRVEPAERGEQPKDASSASAGVAPQPTAELDAAETSASPAEHETHLDEHADANTGPDARHASDSDHAHDEHADPSEHADFDEHGDLDEEIDDLIDSAEHDEEHDEAHGESPEDSHHEADAQSPADPLLSEQTPSVEQQLAEQQKAEQGAAGECQIGSAEVAARQTAAVPAVAQTATATATAAAQPQISSRMLSRLAARTARANKKEKKRQKLEAAFKDYFQFSEPLSRIPPHRVLAINRGERARILRVKLEVDPEPLFAAAEKCMLTGMHPFHELLAACLRDALQRLVLPSLEREVRRELTEASEQHAVEVFIRNLRKLLLQPPVRGRRVLAVDPGFRNGCKLIALDEFGNVLGHDIMHVVGREERKKAARAKLVQMIRQYGSSVVAVGNGTGCRETEQLVADAISEELQDTDVAYVIVNEAGASVYSTSPIGREELPDYDPVLRSAISIGRRLLDPLSELVKINPANIGVGLYQHDVKAKHLRESLDAVVESCVNYVGVDVNTASPALLRYVSGLNQLTARRLYEYRRTNGPFRTREDFKRVPSVGEATFVQAAGFLKINDGDNPLDATWIHPESYEVALRVLEKLGASVDVLRPLPPRPAAQPKTDEPAATDALAAQAPESILASAEIAPEAAPQEDFAVARAPEASLVAVAEPPAAPQPPDVIAADAGTPVLAAEAATGEPTPEPATSDFSANDISTSDVPTSDVSTNDLSASNVSASNVSANEISANEISANEISDDQAWEAAQESRQAARAVLAESAAAVSVPDLARELGISELLLKDLLAALVRPGRDPREDLPPPVFRRGIMKLEDLKPGMELSGTVLNVVDFGAFVDIGLTESGLVHISRLADRYIRDPHEVVGVGDTIRVWVLDVDKERRRVSLTAVPPGTERRKPEPRQRHTGQPHAKPRPPRQAGAAKQAAAPASAGQAQANTQAHTHEQAQGQKPAQAGRSSQQQQHQQRPPRRERGKRPPRTGGKGRTWTATSSLPATPLTKEMEEGKEPLRSFADLLQFYEKKKSDDSGSAEAQ